MYAITKFLIQKVQWYFIFKPLNCTYYKMASVSVQILGKVFGMQGLLENTVRGDVSGMKNSYTVCGGLKRHCQHGS